MKNISILGVTGSIGLQSIDVCVAHPDLFKVVGVSCGRNIKVLEEVILQVHPKYVSVINKKDCEQLALKYPDIIFYYGEEGLEKIATLDEIDLVLNAVVGIAGLKSTIACIEAKKDLALANKESLVVGGHLVMPLVEKMGVHLYPVDSEHSAIFQSMFGQKHEQIHKLIITASGGSFRNRTRDELVGVTKQEALNHPNWSMGAKITIDSATMFNKGLEVMEAKWLFNVDYDDIIVLMHPESIIHSMVEYKDTAIIAQLGTPDMRLPIQYALTYPDRLEIANSKRLHLEDVMTLNFKKADLERYPALGYAYHAGRVGGSLPCVLNGANEQAVALFLDDKIEFLDIERLVKAAMDAHEVVENPNLQQLMEIDAWARQYVLDNL